VLFAAVLNAAHVAPMQQISPHISSPIPHRGLQMSSRCTTPVQFTDALYDQAVTNILIDADIDMASEFQRWRELGGVVLKRNVTIAGSPALALPIINWNYWPQDVPGAW
jgi:hypothetical protein